jgi:hypothetical protein
MGAAEAFLEETAAALLCHVCNVSAHPVFPFQAFAVAGSSSCSASTGPCSVHHRQFRSGGQPRCPWCSRECVSHCHRQRRRRVFFIPFNPDWPVHGIRSSPRCRVHTACLVLRCPWRSLPGSGSPLAIRAVSFAGFWRPVGHAHHGRWPGCAVRVVDLSGRCLPVCFGWWAMAACPRGAPWHCSTRRPGMLLGPVKFSRATAVIVQYFTCSNVVASE